MGARSERTTRWNVVIAAAAMVTCGRGSAPASQAAASLVAGVSGVVWSVDEGSSGGSVSAGGLYSAPQATGTFHVRATSAADASQSSVASVMVTGGGDSGVCAEAPGPHPQTEQTVCSRTVPESVEPSIACTPYPIGGAEYDGCSGANKACGSVTGCVLERNEAIDGLVSTIYAPGPAGFMPPPPPADPGSAPIRGMGVTMHGTTSAWFGRGDQPAVGSCGYPPVRNLLVTAISHTQFGTSDDASRFDSAYWCGACAELVGRTGKRVRVMIIDQCTGCTADNLDMVGGADSPLSIIGEGFCPSRPSGEPPVDWKIVPCETCGGLVVHYVEGFNAGDPSIQLRNHRLPVVKLEEKHHGAWLSVRRESHNEYYLPRNGEDALPLELRITAIDGSTITGSFPVFEPGKSYEASSQF